MRGPERDQLETDEEKELYGQMTLIVAPAEEKDHTRQEFAQEADINFLLRKYGAVPPIRIGGGVWDFDVDLQRAFDAVREVRDGYRRIPEEVRRVYPTPQALLEAVMRGEVSYKAEDGSAGGSAEPAAASASESAPGKGKKPAQGKQEAANEEA